jgi:hypothetical protein
MAELSEDEEVDVGGLLSFLARARTARLTLALSLGYWRWSCMISERGTEGNCEMSLEM